MADDGFQFVSKKKAAKRRHRSVNPKILLGISSEAFEDLNEDEFDRLESRLKEGMDEFLKTEFWTSVEDILNKTPIVESISALVCYGIGSFATCLIARQQLLFALALSRKVLKNHEQSAFIYDPLYSESHNKFLETKLNFRVIRENEEGKRSVETPTLFLMPHCGKSLYNNLLWRNWAPQSLSNVVIIGNSFHYMNESTPRRILEAEANYVLKIVDHCVEVRLENSFPQSDVFNNTSIHLFPERNLHNATSELWLNCEEPKYTENVEIQLKI